MLRAVLICPARDLADHLQAALDGLPVILARRLEHYPSEMELGRLLRSMSPQAVFLSAGDTGEAAAVAHAIEKLAPGVHVLALGSECDPSLLLEMMRAGVREYLHAPFERGALEDALLRVEHNARHIPCDEGMDGLIFSFLPSKAGVGASTIALNTSAALSRMNDTRVLLADFDLSSGLIAFMLKLEGPYAVTDAAQNAFALDQSLWRQLVTCRGTLDVLASGKHRLGFRIEPAQIRSLLDYVRRYYKVICLDLSGNLEKYSLEIMHLSKRVFLVCTSELPSLHLGREKVALLRSAELDDRISVILNRTNKRDVMSRADVEKLLGLPVKAVLPNDYVGVHRALASGMPVEPSSALGRQFSGLAASLLAGGGVEDSCERRFVDYFSLMPAHYTLTPTRKRQAS